MFRDKRGSVLREFLIPFQHRQTEVDRQRRTNGSLTDRLTVGQTEIDGDGQTEVDITEMES